jgi:PAS domain-containing protein
MLAVTRHSDHLAVDNLFRLVAYHLDCSMAVLSTHDLQNERAEILATFHMTDELAMGISRSIQEATPQASASLCTYFDIEREYLPEGASSGTRFTFVCHTDPTFFLALSACRLDSDQGVEWTLPAQEIQGWVDAHLRLVWQSRRDRGCAEMLAQALDLFDFGTFLLDPDGNMIFANSRAGQLLDLGEGLCRVGQSVTATDFEDAVRLQTAIHHLSRSGNGRVAEVDGASLMLVRRANARPLVAVLTRLSDCNAGNGTLATALFVLDPDIDTQPLTMALCRAYGLTRTEAGLVIRLVEGLTIDSAASEMRIQTQTARTYLKQIFAKTDTHRQADLVRVILGGMVRIRSSASLTSNGGVVLPI